MRAWAVALATLLVAGCAAGAAPSPAPLALPSSAPSAAPSPSPTNTLATNEILTPPAVEPSRRPRSHDCDPGGKAPTLCVAPSETEGPVRAGACREAPRQSVCTGCRPVFDKVEAGRCCYLGLSRFPRCAE